MDRNKDKKLIRFDWAMKRLLRDKANPVVLEGLLTSLFGKEIKIIDFLESEGNRDAADEKSNRVDIVAQERDGSKILIEVQNETEDSFIHRILFGTSRMIVDHIKKGEPYEKVPKVYSVNIVYFDLGDGSDYVYHGTTEFLGLHSRLPLLLRDKIKTKYQVETPADILPEYYILIANDFNRWSKTPLDQWMYFLGTSTIPAEADAPGLKEAREQLDIDRLSEEDRNAYYRHLDNMRSLIDTAESRYTDGLWDGEKIGFEKGLERGIEKGIEKGRNEVLLQVAGNLLRSGMPVSEAAKITGLREEEINPLLSI